jgi:hypothetical protein
MSHEIGYKIWVNIISWLITMRSSGSTSNTWNYATCSAMSSKHESGLYYKLVHHITYTQHTHASTSQGD